MPDSDRARFEHEEFPREFEPRRIRTVVQPNGTEIRVGFSGDRSEVISVLRPKARVGTARERYAVLNERSYTAPQEFAYRQMAEEYARVRNDRHPDAFARVVPVRGSKRARAHPRRLR